MPVDGGVTKYFVFAPPSYFSLSFSLCLCSVVLSSGLLLSSSYPFPVHSLPLLPFPFTCSFLRFPFSFPFSDTFCFSLYLFFLMRLLIFRLFSLYVFCLLHLSLSRSLPASVPPFSVSSSFSSSFCFYFSFAFFFVFVCVPLDLFLLRVLTNRLCFFVLIVLSFCYSSPFPFPCLLLL